MYRSLLAKTDAKSERVEGLNLYTVGLFENLNAEHLKKCENSEENRKNVYKIAKKKTLLNLKTVYEYLTISVSNVSHAIIMKYIWLEYKKWADEKTESSNLERLSKIKNDKRQNIKKSKNFKGMGGSESNLDKLNVPIDVAFLDHIKRIFSDELGNSKYVWETIFESFDTHFSSLDLNDSKKNVYFDGEHFEELSSLNLDNIENDDDPPKSDATVPTKVDDADIENEDDDDGSSLIDRFINRWEEVIKSDDERCFKKRKNETNASSPYSKRRKKNEDNEYVVDESVESFVSNATRKRKRSEDIEAMTDDEPIKKARTETFCEKYDSLNILSTVSNIYDTFRKELRVMDLKNMVHVLKMEIVSMDLETGNINTNTLSGDERFEAMLFCLDLFEWTRGDSQVEMHEEMMMVMLPLIYGDEWMTNHEHILVRHNVLKYYPDLVMICARRWGKTTGTAMMVGTGILFIPSMKCIVFATGQRVSFLFMDEIVKMMAQSPFMSSCEIIISNSESLIIKHFGNLRELRAMPANLEVSVTGFFVFFLFLRDTVCTFCLFRIEHFLGMYAIRYCAPCVSW